MRSLPVNLFLLLLTLLTACSKSAVEELNQELDTTKSWTATAEMVGDAWRRSNVPTTYAQHTLSQAEEKLQTQTMAIAHSSTNPTQRQTLLKQLQQIESTVSQMSTAAKQKDYTAMSQHLKQLSTQEQTLSTLAKTVGGH